MVLAAAARRRGVRRTAPPARPGSPRRPHVIDTERALLVHRRGSRCSYAFPAEEVGELPSRTRAGGARASSRAVGCRRRVARGGPPTRPLPAEPVPPRRLPADVPWAARRRRGHRSGGHHGHDHRLRNVARDPPLCRAVIGAHGLLRRSATSTYCNYKGYATYWSAVIGDAVVDGRGVELPGSAAGNPAHQGIFQL